MEFLFLLLLGGGLALATPIMAIVALVKISDLRLELARVTHQFRDIQTRLSKLERPRGEAPPEPEPRPATPERAAPPETIAARPPTPAAMPPAPPPPPATPEPPEWVAASPAPAARKEGLEEKFLPLLLPGLAAIAAVTTIVFLVRHAIEMNWLGPAVQCILGSVFGLSLIAGGELLRRHPFEKKVAAIKPSFITPALMAAGVSGLFISIYAAYGVYDLLPWWAAFAMLWGVWMAAIALSILHGPFVAALGILGGFLVPILVQTGNPSAYKLFPYITAVNGAALAVLRYKGWGWLAWGTLAGAAFWPVLWMMDQYDNLGAPALGAYLTATAILFTYLPSGLVRYGKAVHWPQFLGELPKPALLSWVSSLAMLSLALLLTWADDFQAGSVTWAGLLGAFLMVAGRRDVTFDVLAVAAAFVAAIVLATWRLPYWPGEIDVLDTIPPGLVPFVAGAAGYAVLFGGGGLILMRGAERPALWAGVSAGTPIVALAIAFAQIRNYEVALEWAAMGLILAGFNLGAAIWVSRKRGEPGMEGALAAYAVGVVAAVSLAMTMALENAWLTVALSLQLPALGWIYGHTKVHGLRHVALLVAGAVLVRLVFNYELFDYRLGATPGLNWMFYGYGIPTIAFYVAASLFRKAADDRLVIALETGALAFLTLFCTMEIADIVHRGQFLPGDDLLETSLRTIAWATIAFALLWHCRSENPRIVAWWGWRILALLAFGQVALLHLLGLNPLLTGDPVGSRPIVNLLLLAYAAPALFALAFRLETRRQKIETVPDIAGISGLALIFAWLSIELRHAFHGTTLNPFPTSDTEWYAYSGLWLAYALVLLGLCIWRKSNPLRYASLVVLGVALVKIFLFDTTELGGMIRVLSVGGLSISLIGMSWVYRRYVFPPKLPDAELQPSSS